jgi:hypothetical protein
MVEGLTDHTALILTSKIHQLRLPLHSGLIYPFADSFMT